MKNCLGWLHCLFTKSSPNPRWYEPKEKFDSAVERADSSKFLEAQTQCFEKSPKITIKDS